MATPKDSRSKRALVESVGDAVRKMGAQSVVTSQAVADRFGLHTTDLECLDLIFLRGNATPGDLCRSTGLTSGSMTAAIDRLERRGLVVRVADPDDRRRTLVRVCPEAIAPIAQTYQPMQAAMFELWSGYTAKELALVEDFVRRSTELARDCVERLRASPPPAPPVRPAARRDA